MNTFESLLDGEFEFDHILELFCESFSKLPCNGSQRTYKWCYYFFKGGPENENTFPDGFLESFGINLQEGSVESDYNIFNGFIGKMVEQNGFRFQLQIKKIVNKTEEDFKKENDNGLVVQTYVVGHGIMQDHKLSYLYYSVLEEYTELCIENIRHTDNSNLEPILYNLKQNIISLKERIIEGLITKSNLDHQTRSNSAVSLGRRR